MKVAFILGVLSFIIIYIMKFISIGTGIAIIIGIIYHYKGDKLGFNLIMIGIAIYLCFISLSFINGQTILW
jgi:hypothetical protein